MSTFPLSFAQERLWFIDQFEPTGPLYNIYRAFRIRGRLNRNALRVALDAVVARHAVLRTNFDQVDGRPIQIVAPVAPADFQAIDLGTRSGQTPPEDILELLIAEGSRPFDLQRDRLFRAVLITAGEDSQFLVLTMHHIVSDGWSLGILFRELKELYSAYAAGRSPELPALPIQYTDYACWQREWLQGETLRTLGDYWKQTLAGAAPVLRLPTDRPRPPRQSNRGSSLSFSLPADLAEPLRALSRQERVTLFMTMLAAFNVLLYRYTGQTDISVGTPIANRTRLETEPLIGFFVNTLVLRSELSDALPFRELLRRVRTTSLEALAHQELPFDKLVELLRPQRTLSHPPLFQVLLAFQNFPAGALELPGVTLETVRLPGRSSKFDFHVSLQEHGARLDGVWEYNTDLFDKSTAERMCRHFEIVLRGIVADPGQVVSALPLLDHDERDRILVAWNRTESAYPRDLSVHGIFEAQARQSPEAIAVVEHDRQMTYAELNTRSNRLGHYLRQLGVGPETVVGISAERSIETLVGLLGILKAGGTYLPLDPSYPPERLAFMVQDAGAATVLMKEGTPSEPAYGDARIVHLDLEDDALRGQSDENPENLTAATDLAYVMYTSGSTGVPKGVAIPHRAINRLAINTNYVRFQPSDRVAHVSNLSFDAATFEIWGALLNGARLVVISNEDALAPRVFADVLERHEISVMFLTVALFNMIAQQVPGAFRLVRDLLVGGELPDPRWIREVMKAGRPHRILNAYGPTETTTFACCYEIPGIEDGETSTIPIGYPVSNTRVYIVDANNQPVPVGVPGELLIGGDGLAREYVRRPDITREKFIRDPFSSDPDARLYRSGDVARYRSDGAIEFLGRTDHQVKLRGFRIELGEVEAVLKQYPAVDDAVVLLHEDPHGEKRLVAYVQSRAHSATKKDLSGFLEAKLPAYEIPSDFVVLERLPRNPNGKVDRSALHVQMPATTRSHTRVPPRDRVEQVLVGIWESTLQVKPVGITDDFFDLGGHSLSAARVFSRIEAVFGKTLPIATLFDSPTIEALAVRVREQFVSGETSCVVEIQPGEGGIPIFFVHGIGGNVVSFRELARLLGSDRPVYGIQARGLYDDHPPDTSIETMAAHYVAAIRVAWPQGPYALAGLSFGGVVAFEMARQLTADGAQVALLALLDAAALGSYRLVPKSTQIRKVSSRLGRRITYHARNLWRLHRRQKIDYLVSRARTLRRRARSAVWRMQFRLYVTLGHLRAPSALGSAGVLPERFRNVTESLTLAARHYTPRPYAGSATLFRAREKAAIFLVDPALGWSGLVQRLEIREVPGDHATLLMEPNVRALALELRQCLEEAQTHVAHQTERGRRR